CGIYGCWSVYALNHAVYKFVNNTGHQFFFILIMGIESRSVDVRVSHNISNRNRREFLFLDQYNKCIFQMLSWPLDSSVHFFILLCHHLLKFMGTFFEIVSGQADFTDSLEENVGYKVIKQWLGNSCFLTEKLIFGKF